jgi:hypothetical protein
VRYLGSNAIAKSLHDLPIMLICVPLRVVNHRCGGINDDELVFPHHQGVEEN